MNIYRHRAFGVSLWCRCASASAPAGTLFIYTSDRSASPDLQHKLCQASWGTTCVTCVDQKKPLHKEYHVEIERIWKLSYSVSVHSNQMYSTCISHADFASCSRSVTESICFLYRFLSLTKIDLTQAVLSSFFCIWLIKKDNEDKNRKRLLAVPSLSPPSRCQIRFPYHSPERLCSFCVMFVRVFQTTASTEQELA